MAIMKRTAVALAVRTALAALPATAAIAAVARESHLSEETVEECVALCPACRGILTEQEEAAEGVCEACERLDALAWLDDDEMSIEAGCAGTRGQA